MKIGVLLPTMDDGDEARTAIGDLLSQTREPDEIVIVDDSESRYTTDMLSRFEDKITEITVIDGPGSTLGAALNRGLEELDTEMVARMDADDRCHSERFERQINYIRENDLDICGTAAIVDGPFGEDERYPDEEVEMEFAMEKCPLVHGSVMMRSDAIEELGGYDESYTSSEDYDLWLRAIDQGYFVGNIQQLLYRLNLHDDSVYGERLMETKLEGLRARRSVQEGKQFQPSEITANVENDEMNQIHLECSMERLRYSDRRGAIKHAIAALPQETLAVPLIGLAFMPGFVIMLAISVYRKI